MTPSNAAIPSKHFAARYKTKNFRLNIYDSIGSFFIIVRKGHLNIQRRGGVIIKFFDTASYVVWIVSLAG